MLDDLSFRLLSEMQELIPLKNIFEDLKKRVDSLLPEYSHEEIREAYGEIKALKEDGLLFSDLQDIEIPVSAKKADGSIKALCLHVSHDCNLSCEYCFASKGDYKSGRRLMPKEVALRATDYLVENSGERYNIRYWSPAGESTEKRCISCWVLL